MKKYFDDKASALAFADTINNILEIAYKPVGKNAMGEDICKWVVHWDNPSFDDLYPAMPIEY